MLFSHFCVIALSFLKSNLYIPINAETAISASEIPAVYAIDVNSYIVHDTEFTSKILLIFFSSFCTMLNVYRIEDTIGSMSI